jgi:quinol---cytochrome c reductase iron-sulfur subunit
VRLPERIALALGVVRAVRGAPPEETAEGDSAGPRERRLPRDPRAELAVAVLLVAGGLLAAAFAVLVVVHPDTQLLGGLLAAALAAVGVALALASRRVVVQEVAVEERRPPQARDEAALAAQLRAGGEGITRRRALTVAAGVACCGLAGAALLPVTALGPSLGDAQGRTPWRRGRRLVDPLTGAPLQADDFEIGSFQSALPDGADPEQLGAPVVVVRVDPRQAPAAPEGLMAFSSICTHAGCAVTLFRYPVDRQTSKGPALVCPCHYSTFDVLHGARPIFGPAARPLPRLPLAIGRDRSLVAAGPLSGTVGPAWWGTKPA